jgi:hypothetical protein
VNNHDFVRILGHADDINACLTLARDRACARDLPHDLARDLALNLAVACDLARCLALVRDPTCDLTLARALARHLAHGLLRAHTRAVHIDHLVTRPLREAEYLAEDLVGTLERLSAAPAEKAMEHWQTSPSAEWLTGVAARLLPAVERGRYVEEWRAELWDLAAERVPRRRQVAYALRIVAGAWSTRRGILEGRRRTAGG